jgi:TPR repeat protein
MRRQVNEHARFAALSNLHDQKQKAQTLCMDLSFYGVRPNLALEKHTYHLLRLDELMRLVSLDDTEAIAELGYRKRFGIGIAEDGREGWALTLKAARRGHPLSIGRCFAYGHKVEVSRRKAFLLFQLSSDNGHPAGHNSLGTCYDDGDGVEVNAEEAVRLYKLSAAKGHSFGQCNLARSMKKGIGTPKDLESAFRYFRLSALQGNTFAAESVARFYDRGTVVGLNEHMAMYYHRISHPERFEPEGTNDASK